jgi:hypothetical protein
MCYVFILRKKYLLDSGSSGDFWEQRDIVKCNRSHSPLLSWIFVQSLRRTMWWCQDNICGISIVGVWAATFIKKLVDSSGGNQERIWSLVVHRNKIIKFGVCKDLDVEIILVTIFLSQENFSNSHWDYMPNIRGLHTQKAPPLFFGDKGMNTKEEKVHEKKKHQCVEVSTIFCKSSAIVAFNFNNKILFL